LDLGAGAHDLASTEDTGVASGARLAAQSAVLGIGGELGAVGAALGLAQTAGERAGAADALLAADARLAAAAAVGGVGVGVDAVVAGLGGAGLGGDAGVDPAIADGGVGLAGVASGNAVVDLTAGACRERSQDQGEDGRQKCAPKQGGRHGGSVLCRSRLSNR